jgi:hypothetical protein
MTILCFLGRHAVEPSSIGWIGSDEVGRCRRCSCDLRRNGADWKPLPPGLKLVPRSPQLGLRRISVVGERPYSSRRAASVDIFAFDTDDSFEWEDRYASTLVD